MAADPVTPTAGNASTVVTGSTAVVAALASPKGGFITNPASAADQGVDPPESIFVDPVGVAGLEANGTTFEIVPGGTWELIAGQTTETSVNALTSGHKFSVVVW